MKCPYCGKEVKEGSKFCDGCGAKLDGEKETKQEYAYSYTPQKKSKTGLIVAIVIISVLLIAGIIIGIVLLSSGDKKENNSNKTNQPSYNNNMKDTKNTASLDKVSYKDYVLDNGDVILMVENNNKDEITLNVKTSFLDKDEVEVDSNTESVIGLPGGATTVFRYHTEREYDSYKFKPNTLSSSHVVSHYKDVEISAKDDKENEEIVVTFKNNSSKEIDDAKVAILFYKDNKLVGYSYRSEYGIEANKAMALYVYYPFDENYKYVEFDSFEAYLVTAYSYDY